MRQLTYVGPGQVEWHDVPAASVREATDAVVRPLAVARCDLDLPMAEVGLFPGPFAVGGSGTSGSASICRRDAPRTVTVATPARQHRVR
jgi:hypothetical protein